MNNRIERLEQQLRKSDVPYVLYVQDRDNPDLFYASGGQSFTRAELEAMDSNAPLLIVEYDNPKGERSDSAN